MFGIVSDWLNVIGNSGIAEGDNFLHNILSIKKNCLIGAFSVFRIYLPSTNYKFELKRRTILNKKEQEGNRDMCEACKRCNILILSISRICHQEIIAVQLEIECLICDINYPHFIQYTYVSDLMRGCIPNLIVTWHTPEKKCFCSRYHRSITYTRQHKKKIYSLSSPTHDIPGCDGAFGNTEKEN